jgi:hypothetical protein
MGPEPGAVAPPPPEVPKDLANAGVAIIVATVVFVAGYQYVRRATRLDKLFEAKQRRVERQLAKLRKKWKKRGVLYGE